MTTCSGIVHSVFTLEVKENLSLVCNEDVASIFNAVYACELLSAWLCMLSVRSV